MFMLHKQGRTPRKEQMKITRFSEEVAVREGKKKQISIAQIKEVLKIVNVLLDGELYKVIRSL